MKRLDPKCLGAILQFVMDRQLETGAVDCQEAEETRDHIVRLLEDEANKENKTFIIYPDKDQKACLPEATTSNSKSAARISACWLI